MPDVGGIYAQTVGTECTVMSVEMETIDCIQGSEEWYQARLGFVTASNFSKVLNKKSGRGLYMRKIAAERLTGYREDEYKNDIMFHGNEIEDIARNVYQMIKDCEVQQVGFVRRDDDVGGSPDGLIDEDGLIEIKCPLPSTHIEYIISNKVPSKYIPQIQGLLWITGRAWCDFVSYDNRIVSKPMHIIRVERDSEYINDMAANVNVFVKELKALINKIDDGTF